MGQVCCSPTAQCNLNLCPKCDTKCNKFTLHWLVSHNVCHVTWSCQPSCDVCSYMVSERVSFPRQNTSYPAKRWLEIERRLHGDRENSHNGEIQTSGDIVDRSWFASRMAPFQPTSRMHLHGPLHEKEENVKVSYLKLWLGWVGCIRRIHIRKTQRCGEIEGRIEEIRRILRATKKNT